MQACIVIVALKRLVVTVIVAGLLSETQRTRSPSSSSWLCSTDIMRSLRARDGIDIRRDTRRRREQRVQLVLHGWLHWRCIRRSRPFGPRTIHARDYCAKYNARSCSASLAAEGQTLDIPARHSRAGEERFLCELFIETNARTIRCLRRCGWGGDTSPTPTPTPTVLFICRPRFAVVVVLVVGGLLCHQSMNRKRAASEPSPTRDRAMMARAIQFKSISIFNYFSHQCSRAALVTLVTSESSHLRPSPSSGGHKQTV